ncbi:hypothetical protein BK634_13190 [Pseudomonas chlororaphis]|jgi:hypothetical protein|nr:hypothetical protein BK634_13190 [Pseudomonas chlororaphis]
MSCANCVANVVDVVDVNRFDASGIKSMEFHSTDTSDQTMKLLGKSRDTLPMNVDVNGFDATGIKFTNVYIAISLTPNRTSRIQLFGCP